jgi:hypothetical protein
MDHSVLFEVNGYQFLKEFIRGTDFDRIPIWVVVLIDDISISFLMVWFKLFCQLGVLLFLLRTTTRS